LQPTYTSHGGGALDMSPAQQVQRSGYSCSYGLLTAQH
jgi:hypothetical protein